MLRDGGIQFQVCKNTNVKCAVVEGAHRTKVIGCTSSLLIKIPTDI